jgi:hypothetical protein
VETPPVVTSPIDTPFEEAPTVDGTQEIKVETPAEKPVETPPVVTSPVDTPFEEAPTVDGTQEIKVETPAEKPVDTPPVVTSPIDTPFEPAPTVDGEQEIKVEAPKPEKPVIEAPPVVIPPGTVDVSPPKDVVEEPPAGEEKPDKDKDKPPFSIEDIIKLITAIGAGGSGTKPTTPGGGVTTPSLGGALPKYTLSRQQLRPDIDYFTYGTRPEAKFFEYGMQLEKPEPPPAGVKPPSEEEKPMAVGGLTGYADGGSNESRYVDGPGSGREDKIPALLSDGEYVIDAETLALLGDGSTKEGARRMDQFRANIRQHKGRALSRGRISPNAKSPDKYMGGGLT